MKKLFSILCLLAATPAAMAYIGPGAGISLIGSVLGVIATVFLVFFAILAWPIRRMLKRRKQAVVEAAATTDSETADATATDSED